ncbi:hypothetical protein [Longispora fulva]|nr:hypothetical protein [Longispora fulva]
MNDAPAVLRAKAPVTHQMTRRLVWAGVAVAVTATAVLTYVVTRSTPTHRTDPRVDASAAATGAVAVPVASATPAVCGSTAKGSPVTLVKGAAECSLIVDIANRYQAAIGRGEAAGQGLFASVADWSCSWPYVAGRSHADSYLTCVRESDGAELRIGT